MSQIRRLSAILLAAAILTGIPYLLLWNMPWPQLPDSWAVASAYLRGWQLPPGVPMAVLIIALWGLWGLYTAGLAVEALSRLRGIPGRLRPLGPLQVVAAAAVGTVAVSPAVAFADTVISQEEGGAQSDRQAETDSASQEDQAPQPVERVRTVSGFGVGSADLTDQMRDDLAPVADMIDSYGESGTPVRITGHADASGPADLNQELSEQRAEAVADHLEEVLGEDAPQMVVDGVGSEQPREGGAAAQRRAEVSYTVVPQQPAPVQAEEMSAQTEEVETEDSDGVAELADRDEEVLAAVASAEEDGGSVLVVEIPDGVVSGAVGFVGLVGGYLLGKRGVQVPRVALSLPRLLPRGERRLALPAPPPRPVPGQDIDERVTVELDHVPGLGITGKGAHGAARRLIANALTGPASESVRVLLTERDAVLLMGDRGLDTLRERPVEPVRMVGTMEEALAVLQHELHLGAEEGRTPPAAPLALVATPSPRHETALAGLLLHGQRHGITAVILGRWPLGGSCVIEEDGLITETSNPLNSVFHCSWPGATAEQVIEAIQDYRFTPRPDVETGTVESGGAPAEASSDDAATAEAVTAEAATADATDTEDAVDPTGSTAQTALEEEEPAETSAAKRPRFLGRSRSAKASSGAVDEASSGFWDADLWETDFWDEEPTGGGEPAPAQEVGDPTVTLAEEGADASAEPSAAVAAPASTGTPEVETSPSAVASPPAPSSPRREDAGPATARADTAAHKSDLEAAFAGLAGAAGEGSEQDALPDAGSSPGTSTGEEGAAEAAPAKPGERDGEDVAQPEEPAIARTAAERPRPVSGRSGTGRVRSTAQTERADSTSGAETGREAAGETGSVSRTSERARAQQARTASATAEGTERAGARSRTQQPVTARAGAGGSEQGAVSAGTPDTGGGSDGEKAAAAPRALRYKPKKAGRARPLNPRKDG